MNRLASPAQLRASEMRLRRVLESDMIGIAFWLSPLLTLFVLACGAVLAFVSRRFIRSAKQLGANDRALIKSYTSVPTLLE